MAEVARVGWWRRRALAWALGVKAADVPSTVTLSLTDPSGWAKIGERSYSGKVVDESQALKVATVWACNKILSDAMATYPLSLYERDAAGNAVKVRGHPASEILSSTPNADMTAPEFFGAGQLNLGMRGNAYSFLDRVNGVNSKLVSLYPIPSANARPKKLADGRIVYDILDRGKWETFPREKIWHVKGFTLNGLIGLSPISAAREAMGLALATEEFQARFFGQGGSQRLVIKTPAWLKEDQRKEARELIQRKFGGLENAHKVELLEGGMEADTIGEPFDNMQFEQLRKFSVLDICRFYLVPPHMVGDMQSGASFSSIEQKSRDFVDYTLRPWATIWERSAERWLLTAAERARYFFRFNFDVLLRGDALTRARVEATQVQNGIISRNEARAKENLGRSEDAGMDAFTAQVNLTGVEGLPGVGGNDPNANPNATQ